MSEREITTKDGNDRRAKRTYWECWRKPVRTMLRFPMWAQWFIHNLFNGYGADAYLPASGWYRAKYGFWHAIWYWIWLAWVKSRLAALDSILIPPRPYNRENDPYREAMDAFTENYIRAEIREFENVARYRATPKEQRDYFQEAERRWKYRTRIQLFHYLDWLIPWKDVRQWIVTHWPTRLLPRYDLKFWEGVEAQQYPKWQYPNGVPREGFTFDLEKYIAHEEQKAA